MTNIKTVTFLKSRFLMDDVLVLNFTYEVLRIAPLKRALKLVFAGKAEIVHRYLGTIFSERSIFDRPSTVRMLYYIGKRKGNVRLTRKAVLIRDDHTCQYCSVHGNRSMTIDHIHPQSKGGKSTWENLVACCQNCNSRKGNRALQDCNMKLKRKPRQPQYFNWMKVNRNTGPDEWKKYLFWDTPIGSQEQV
jgi:5-methylcytosine-specific restriction endonuclease McrA